MNKNKIIDVGNKMVLGKRGRGNMKRVKRVKYMEKDGV